MKRIVATLFAVFALALLSAAQTGDNDKNAQKSAKTSHGSTITGCLSGPNSENVYTLKAGKREVEVGGLEDLSKHVGHEVKLHGSWAKSGNAIGEKEATGTEEKAEGKEEKGERHFKVSSIDMVSEKCSGGGGSTTPK